MWKTNNWKNETAQITVIKMKQMKCKKCKKKNVFKVVESNTVLKLIVLECPECGSRVMMSERQFKGDYRFSDKIGSKLRKLLKDVRALTQWDSLISISF
ncbi:MAG: hypothetical protein CW716_08800 [Candidatus Bathyarchaeum sp.]|nr:MAG: hypothetical protein CW716_08800 [Candidatus Bathyarchaeum sp.]